MAQLPMARLAADPADLRYIMQEQYDDLRACADPRTRANIYAGRPGKAPLSAEEYRPGRPGPVKCP